MYRISYTYKCIPCLQDHGINEAQEDEAKAAEVEEAVGEARREAPTPSTLICRVVTSPAE